MGAIWLVAEGDDEYVAGLGEDDLDGLGYG